MNNHIVVASFLAVALRAGMASAADPVAESMFQRGLQLMNEGQFEEACRTLAASQKLEPKSGTLAVLGSCHEQVGKTASAWAEYKEAAALARSEGRQNHADKATELAKALEPKLSMLRIDAQLLQGGVTIVVKVDGANVVDGSLGVAFAVDPGDHVVTASAPGRKEWTTKVRVGPNGDRQIVTVPELEPAPHETPLAPTNAEPAPLVPTATPQDAPVWPWFVGSAGLASLGVSVVGLVVSSSASSKIEERCGAERNLCPRDYDADADHGREVAGFGIFVGFGAVGLGALATGIVGLALPSDAESTTRTAVWADPSGAGFRIVGDL